MKQLTKRQAELAAKLFDHVIRTVHIFAEAHKEELEEEGEAIVLKSLTLTTAWCIAAGSAAEDAQRNAEVFANELMATVKVLKSQNPTQQ